MIEPAAVLYVTGATDDLDPPYRYRCLHAVEQLRAYGVTAAARRITDVNLGRATQQASVVVLSRLAWSDAVETLIARARAVHALVLFDIDDLIFDEHAASRLSFVKRFSPAQIQKYHALIPRLQRTLRACDGCVASTAPIAACAHALGVPSVVHPNILSQSMVDLAQVMARQKRWARSTERMGYFSGSNTHDCDLESIASALHRVLEHRKSAELLLCGYFGTLPTALKRFANRIILAPFQSPSSYPWLLSTCRVSLAPLEVINEFTDAKSNIKVTEAGVFGVPTVATPALPYRECIVNGQSGFLAHTDDEWTASILACLENGESATYGAQMRRHVCDRYVPSQVKGHLIQRFEELARQSRPDWDGVQRLQTHTLPSRYRTIVNQRLRHGAEAYKSIRRYRGVKANVQTGTAASHRIQFSTPSAPKKCDAGVDIVVPVYNAEAATRRCLQSVAMHATGDVRLVIVDDASTSKELVRWLNEFCSRLTMPVVLLRNQENVGFVKTANRGMSQSDSRDVLLLNSDTEVFEGFIERLKACAYHTVHTGIVSPLSNNATLCSIPDFGYGERYPRSLQPSAYARLVTDCSAATYPELPTCVGFCMYIKREVLMRVGLFNADVYGRGYGEENDLCQRAKKAGYALRLCDDVFVFHEGEASFGAGANPLRAVNEKILESMHPEYRPSIESFVRDRSLERVHKRITSALRRYERGEAASLLMILHASPYSRRAGGTEMHVRDLVSALRLPRVVVLYPAGRGQRAAEINDGNWRQPAFFDFPLVDTTPWFCLEHDGALEAVDRVIDLFHVKAAHIHHLAHQPLNLAKLFTERNIPYVVTCHDYYLVSPNWNLFDHHRAQPCGCEAGCSASCLEATAQRMRTSRAHPLLDDMHQSRHRLHASTLIKQSKALIFPSQTAQQVFMQRAPVTSTVATVIEHGYNTIDLPLDTCIRIEARSGESRPLRIGVAGNVCEPIKGSHAYVALLKLTLQHKLPVEWHFFGTTDEGSFENEVRAVAAQLPVYFHGPYIRETIVGMLRQAELDVMLNLPAWHETFSYTLSEAICAGVPTIASRLGAVGERVAHHRLGIVVDSIEEAFSTLQSLCEDRARLEALRRESATYAHPSLDSNAKQYVELYKSIGLNLADRLSHLDACQRNAELASHLAVDLQA